MVQTVLHETRHLRQFNKIMGEGTYGQAKVAWQFELTPVQKEVYATSTNLWQGRRLGLSSADQQLFTDYYNYFRR